jgi:hypothetical protein
MRKWTENEKQYIRDYYPDTPTEEIALKLHRSIQAVSTYAYILKVKKSENFQKKIIDNLLKNAKDYQFKKGHIPHNAGKQMPIELKEKLKYSFFQKGNKPTNYLPVGTERFRSADNYTYVKVADPNVWKLKQRMIYESIFGEIPNDKNIIFLDKDTTNFNIDNLKLIDKKENMLLNTIHNYPKPIKESIFLLKKIKNKIKQLKK